MQVICLKRGAAPAPARLVLPTAAGVGRCTWCASLLAGVLSLNAQQFGRSVVGDRRAVVGAGAGAAARALRASRGRAPARRKRASPRPSARPRRTSSASSPRSRTPRSAWPSCAATAGAAGQPGAVRAARLRDRAAAAASRSAACCTPATRSCFERHVGGVLARRAASRSRSSCAACRRAAPARSGSRCTARVRRPGRQRRRRPDLPAARHHLAPPGRGRAAAHRLPRQPHRPGQPQLLPRAAARGRRAQPQRRGASASR